MERNGVKVGITGATGFLGTYLSAHLRRAGLRVVEFREEEGLPVEEGVPVVPFTLDSPVHPESLGGLEALIHAAYDFRPRTWDEIVEVNVNGSAGLLKAAREAGVKRIVVISTMAAFDGCRSMYGKAKLLMERDALELGAVVVRPGLMWGGGPGGLVGNLARLVARAAVVPLAGAGRQPLYLNHREDISRFLARAVTEDLGEINIAFTLTCDVPWTFRQILAGLAEAQGRSVRFVSVPWQPLYWGLKTLELIGLRPGFRSDSLVSLMNQDPAPDFTVYGTLGLRFRDFSPREACEWSENKEGSP